MAPASVAAPVPSVPGADDPALAAEVEKLRRAAEAPVARGARTTRSQANASWVTGLLYLHGVGVTASPVEAATWFERARTLGEPLAAAGQAWCAIEGCQGLPNPQAARRSIAALRAVNLPRSQYLQWLLETRLAPLQIAAPGPAGASAETAIDASPRRQLLLDAAQGGDIHARIELGLESAAADRTAEALEHFRAAAPRSSAAAANAALLSERRAKNAIESRPQAMTTATATATAASADDTLARAQRNHRGQGQPANFVEAIRLYRLAQVQGSVQARRMLELIFSRPAANGGIDVVWMQQLANLDLSTNAVSPSGPPAPRILRREPTPLYDLLPASWRKNAPSSLR